jgi:hypothetical protein
MSHRSFQLIRQQKYKKVQIYHFANESFYVNLTTKSHHGPRWFFKKSKMAAQNDIFEIQPVF